MDLDGLANRVRNLETSFQKKLEGLSPELLEKLSDLAQDLKPMIDDAGKLIARVEIAETTLEDLTKKLGLMYQEMNDQFTALNAHLEIEARAPLSSEIQPVADVEQGVE